MSRQQGVGFSATVSFVGWAKIPLGGYRDIFRTALFYGLIVNSFLPCLRGH